MTYSSVNSGALPPLIGFCSPAMFSGKTTVANALVENHGFTRLRFAETLKSMTRAFLAGLGLPWEVVNDMVDGELKEQPIPAIGGRTPRHLMQTLGTEWGRKCVNENVWVRVASNQARMLREDGAAVVFDDLRYANEANAIVAMGGVVVRIIRPEATVTQAHSSEGELDHYPVAYELLNDGGFDGVPARTADMLAALGLLPSQ
jgi:hypothetical protein